MQPTSALPNKCNSTTTIVNTITGNLDPPAPRLRHIVVRISLGMVHAFLLAGLVSKRQSSRTNLEQHLNTREEIDVRDVLSIRRGTSFRPPVGSRCLDLDQPPVAAYSNIASDCNYAHSNATAAPLLIQRIDTPTCRYAQRNQDVSSPCCTISNCHCRNLPRSAVVAHLTDLLT